MQNVEQKYVVLEIKVREENNMSPEIKDKFFRYEELQQAIKELEEERDALKPELLEVIHLNDAVPLLHGKLVVESKKKWVFSEEVQEIEKELDARQKEEKQTGIATYVDGEPFVKYYPNKKNKHG